MTRYALWLSVVAGLWACDSGDKPSDDLVKAMGHVADKQEQAKTRAQAAQRMKALEANAAAKAQQARDSAFAELITVPDALPGNLATACSEVASAYDQFKTGRLSGAALARWNAVKERDLEKLVQTCRARGNVVVAACQSHALSNATTVMIDSDAPIILSQCEDKLVSAKPTNRVAGAAGAP